MLPARKRSAGRIGAAGATRPRPTTPVQVPSLGLCYVQDRSREVRARIAEGVVKHPLGADARGPGQSVGQRGTQRRGVSCGARGPGGARWQRVRRRRRAAASCGRRSGLRRRLRRAPDQCPRSRLSFGSTFRFDECVAGFLMKFRHSIGCVTCPRSSQLWCYAVSRESRRLEVGALGTPALRATRRPRSPRPAGRAAPVVSAAPGPAARAARRRRGSPRAGRAARTGGGCRSGRG